MENHTLYKFRSWDDPRHIETLSKNTIYFSSPADFNDPFDCRITPDLTQLDTDDKINRFAHNTVTSALKNAPQLDYQEEKQKFIHRIKNNLEDEIVNYTKLHRAIQDQYYGIFSLSYRWDSVLMWSHYSNNHKGFCIGFDYKGLKQIEDIGMGWPVNYEDDYPKIDPLLEDMVQVGKLEINTKAKDWQYESEFRLFTLIGVRAKSRIYVLPDSCFKEIIIGLNFPKESIGAIKKIAIQKNIKLYQTVSIKNQFKLSKVEV